MASSTKKNIQGMGSYEFSQNQKIVSFWFPMIYGRGTEKMF